MDLTAAFVAGIRNSNIWNFYIKKYAVRVSVVNDDETFAPVCEM
jgi:hypothetical protein